MALALQRLARWPWNLLGTGPRGGLLWLGIALAGATGLSASAPVLPTATEVIAKVLEADAFTQAVANYRQAYVETRAAVEDEEGEDAEEVEFKPAPPSLVVVLNQVHALASELARRALAQWREDWIGLGGDADAMVALEKGVRDWLTDAVDDVTLEPLSDDLN